MCKRLLVAAEGLSPSERLRRVLLALVPLVLVMSCAQVHAAATVLSTQSPNHKYIVAFNTRWSASLAERVTARVASLSTSSATTSAVIRVGRQFDCSDTSSYLGITCEGDEGRSDDSVCINALADLPEVEYIEPNMPMYASSMYLQQIGSRSWALESLPKPELNDWNGMYEYDFTGQGVNVYVVDTGIYLDHEEFEGRAKMFHSFVDPYSCDDCNGHGTHVAGSVGGKTFGVAKKVNLFAVQVLDEDGMGNALDVAAGVCLVAQTGQKPGVLVLSLGGSPTLTVDGAIKFAHDVGFYSAVAAGNDADNACNYSPARSPYCVTVGNHDDRGNRVWTSNFGRCVQIWAPGDRIRSAFIGSPTNTLIQSGTSMATPHVGGVMAILLQQYPWISYRDLLAILQDMAKQQTLDDPYNTLFPDGSPMLYSLVRSTPCTGACDTITSTFPSLQTSVVVSQFTLFNEGPVGAWIYARDYQDSTNRFTLTALLEVEVEPGVWVPVAPEVSGAAGQDQPLVFPETTVAFDSVGLQHRVRVTRSASTGLTLELLAVVKAPPECSADSTCNNNGQCISSLSTNSSSSGSMFTNSTMQCSCFAGYRGVYCEQDFLGMLSNIAMSSAFVIFLCVATFKLAADLRAYVRSRESKPDTIIVPSSGSGATGSIQVITDGYDETTPLIINPPRPTAPPPPAAPAVVAVAPSATYTFAATSTNRVTPSATPSLSPPAAGATPLAPIEAPPPYYVVVTSPNTAAAVAAAAAAVSAAANSSTPPPASSATV